MEIASAEKITVISLGLFTNILLKLHAFFKKKVAIQGVLLSIGKSSIVQLLSQKFHHLNYIFVDIEDEYKKHHKELKQEKKKECDQINPLQALKDEMNGKNSEVGSVTSEESTTRDIDISRNYLRLPYFKQIVLNLKKQFPSYNIIIFSSSLETFTYLKMNFHSLTPSPNLLSDLRHTISEKRMLRLEYDKMETYRSCKDNIAMFDDWPELLDTTSVLLGLKK
jgi:hypothetical protein